MIIDAGHYITQPQGYTALGVKAFEYGVCYSLNILLLIVEEIPSNRSR
jgi:hypothetical protein